MTASDWSLVVAVAGVVVAVIAMGAGVWAMRRWGTRRNTLQVDYRIRPLRTLHLRTDEGVEVIEPNPPIQFDVELRLTNLGPQDILPEHFREHELCFGFAPAKLFPGRNGSNGHSGFLVLDMRRARLLPRRIAVGQTLHFIIRCLDDRPDLWVDSPLVNVRVRRRRFKDADADPLGLFTLPGSNKWLGSRVTDF